eukprot:2789763-Rhodomonas_salina.3
MAHIVYVSPGRHSKDDLRVEKEIVLYLISRVTSRVVETEWILESALAWYSRSAESQQPEVRLAVRLAVPEDDALRVLQPERLREPLVPGEQREVGKESFERVML